MIYVQLWNIVIFCFRLQNQLGVSVLFTWGVISENNSNHIAIVPGGWNEDYLQDSETYVKVRLRKWEADSDHKGPETSFKLVFIELI